MYDDEYSLPKLPKPKKLVVLDLDNTLCDFYSNDFTSLRGVEVIRPYLHSFLKTIYQYYEIVVWSATPKKPLDSKLFALNMVSNDSYKILFTLNESSMVTVKARIGNLQVKPLSVIWRKLPEYDESNTLIVDDCATNFYLNPRSGIQVKSYFKGEYASDNELQLLTKYLVDIAKHCHHFERINHTLWKDYLVQRNI